MFTAPHGSGSTRYFPGATDGLADPVAALPSAVPAAEPLDELHAVSAASATVNAVTDSAARRIARDEWGRSPDGSTDLAPSSKSRGAVTRPVDTMFTALVWVGARSWTFLVRFVLDFCFR
jgi:hypothetical protein